MDKRHFNRISVTIRRAALLVVVCGWGVHAQGAQVVTGLKEDAAPKANAQAIQTAVDAVAAQGGGCVTVPAGTWRCGTIYLRSNIELNLATNAVIQASTDLADFNDLDAYPENWGSVAEEWVGKHLVIACGVTNVALTGPGTFDGAGNVYYEDHTRRIDPKATGWIYGMRKARNRQTGRLGQLLTFVRAQNVFVGKGLHVRNACCWCLYCYNCADVVIRDYIVRNGHTDGNTDGMDIDCSRNVLIENADVITGDDALAIRGHGKLFNDGQKHICENIRVRNCSFKAEAMGIRIGVGDGHIRNVSIEDVTVHHASHGVSFECYYGKGTNSGVDIENVTLRRFNVEACYSNYRFRVGGNRLTFGVRDVLFDTCQFGAYKLGVNDGPSEGKLHNIRFENCTYDPVSGNPFFGR